MCIQKFVKFASIVLALSLNSLAQSTECDFQIQELNPSIGYPRASGDGRYVVFINSGDLTRLDILTGETVDVDLPFGGSFSVSENGDRIALEAGGLFIYDFSSAESTRLTDPGVESITLSGDGNRVAFRTTFDFGSNPTGSDEWHLLDIPSGTITQLTDTPPGPVNLSSIPGAISHDGRVVCFNGDFGNPVPILGLWQEGVGLRNLDQVGAGYQGLSLNRDGTFLTFISSDDITGENPNHFEQVFGYDIASDQFIQLTHATVFSFNLSARPAFSRDGQHIFHVSAGNYTGQHPDGTLYEIDRQGNVCPITTVDNSSIKVFSETTGRYAIIWNNGQLTMANRGPTVPALSDTALIVLIFLIGGIALALARRARSKQRQPT